MEIYKSFDNLERLIQSKVNDDITNLIKEINTTFNRLLQTVVITAASLDNTIAAEISKTKEEYSNRTIKTPLNVVKLKDIQPSIKNENEHFGHPDTTEDIQLNRTSFEKIQMPLPEINRAYDKGKIVVNGTSKNNKNAFHKVNVLPDSIKEENEGITKNTEFPSEDQLHNKISREIKLRNTFKEKKRKKIRRKIV